MSYRERIANLIQQVPTTLVDLSISRKPVSIPTQASSEFTTNREQGDWAENIILTAINENAKEYVAVRYGKSDDRVAGEEGFAEFYQEFQVELDTIGKRPDVLIFRRADFPEGWGRDISRRPHAELHPLVPKAVAGLEIRSSAFLSMKYEATVSARNQHLRDEVMRLKKEIEDDYGSLLQHPQRSQYAAILQSITPETIGVIDFKRPSWRSSEALVAASKLFSEMKTALEILKKRNFLSITLKVEDLKVVYQWTQLYGVPHFYVQVFFDKAYAVSYEHILSILGNPDNEDLLYFVEADVKNQNKSTIKLNPKEGRVLAGRIDKPKHESKEKELDRGRLLYYVTFKDGKAYLDMDTLAYIAGVPTIDL